jgi:16S rRNA (cytosine967-C5)-methyltransferase
MNLYKILNLNTELFSKIFNKKKLPADVVLADFFRKNHYIGSKERKLLYDLAYNNIRNQILIKDISSGIYKAYPELKKKNLTLYTIINVLLSEINNSHTITNKLSSHFQKYNKNGDSFEFAFDNYINEFFDTLSMGKITKFIENHIELLKSTAFFPTNLSGKGLNAVSTLYSIPVDLIKYLIKSDYISNATQLNQFAQSTLEQSKTHIRIVNPTQNYQSVITFMEANDISFIPHPINKNYLILDKRVNLNNWDIYKKGMVEIQDAGSGLIAETVNPQEGELILDLCAGAGGKSLYMYDLSAGKANLVATDIERKKMNEFNKRIKRLNYSNIRRHVIKPMDLETLSRYEQFDKILIDAPCSGIGTYKRNPQKKYEYSRKHIAGFSKIQEELLATYSPLLKPGGILIYATCSILKQENEDIIENFIKKNPTFSPAPLRENNPNLEVFSELSENGYYCTIHPENYDMDGFFIALLQKNR